LSNYNFIFWPVSSFFVSLHIKLKDMPTIKKSLKPDVSPDEMELTGVTSFVSWERMLPYLKNAVNLKPSEQVRGFIIDEDGVKVLIEYKTK